MSAQQQVTSASSSPVYLPTFRHTIDEEGDLILELIDVVKRESDSAAREAPQAMEVDTQNQAPQTEPTTDEQEPHPIPEVHRKIELLVASRALRLASPVFRAMLAPDRFSEGIAFAANGKEGKITRLSLPDDDPQAMIELCSLMHYQIPPQLYSPNFDQLSELAIIVDK